MKEAAALRFNSIALQQPLFLSAHAKAAGRRPNFGRILVLYQNMCRYTQLIRLRNEVRIMGLSFEESGTLFGALRQCTFGNYA